MMTVVEQAHALQDAIRSGQVVEAERLARLLAKSKALVVVNVDDSRPIDRPVTTVRWVVIVILLSACMFY